MGGVSSTPKVRCDGSPQIGTAKAEKKAQVFEAPPRMVRPMSFEERLYEKFRKQPLVPIGCVATAYFLISGIYSFRKRDPRRSQKMMRARVAAQFGTLAAFVGYMGFDNVNFDVAPAYYRAKDGEKKNEKD
mmetsp:Transcript_49153/g.74745  ORF Transcript_49153/g.74745 Transcript_49153/m.74745 type:complete len:131 (+) Transcript_49153:47-439(+)|eukprot:CAMPEP_0117018610 /NCGR_PEP_ID=MMETSP0472-20121206/14372_1 /TAXON_ID=693140 ORGANISM="Tiarina fusus, Strain LIS" /NCGR_SAMPLE_ID=MMETSP0472 /ASSEMBLY_ACC=CAM_ASM_000603 /LENGTH=130 /DNA_ID=CAMNT_0004723315 /DNA_START=45 /DNA_END=437 /DNA_ORIENTATION=+